MFQGFFNSLLVNESDSDVFPPPFEIDAMYRGRKELLTHLEGLEIEQYDWKAGRRFVVPKHALGFRTATQLDPIDSLVLAAIIKRFGRQIEARRIPESERRVFSYRFKPQDDGRFYGPSSNWHTFWEASLERSREQDAEYVAIADITDFYNQIYHHVLENELADCKLPKPVLKAIKGLLLKLEHRQSRGVPVGPHSVRLLAECSLNSMDKSLLSHGYNFTRYVDDIHFFCPTKRCSADRTARLRRDLG